ncbi:MAG: transglycosylase domain-containing protein, partial [Clostridiales bacterium]|nr:transglycosylase domain-containing protein [Clostridiales bacterium]
MTSDARLDDSKISTGMINNIILFDRNDAPIKTKRGESYVKYSGIPEDIIKAFVAAEDKRFFSHNGVDILRILGAIRNDIKAGALKEGASTINQQLIKNTHLTAEKTLKRKMKEIRLAIELDGKYSKEKIMEA